MNDRLRPNFIGTEDSMITPDGVFPLPEAWRQLTDLDIDAYWKQQDREKRRQAQLEKCELDECTCGETPEQEWTTYGSAVEPGSRYEPNPDCPTHGFDRNKDEGLGDEFEAELEQWENRRDG